MNSNKGYRRRKTRWPTWAWIATVPAAIATVLSFSVLASFVVDAYLGGTLQDANTAKLFIATLVFFSLGNALLITRAQEALHLERRCQMLEDINDDLMALSSNKRRHK